MGVANTAVNGLYPKLPLIPTGAPRFFRCDKVDARRGLSQLAFDQAYEFYQFTEYRALILGKDETRHVCRRHCGSRSTLSVTDGDPALGPIR